MKPYIQVKHGITYSRTGRRLHRYWFRIKSGGNHKIIAWSETYNNKTKLTRAIAIVNGGRKLEVRWP